MLLSTSAAGLKITVKNQPKKQNNPKPNQILGTFIARFKGVNKSKGAKREVTTDKAIDPRIITVEITLVIG